MVGESVILNAPLWHFITLVIQRLPAPGWEIAGHFVVAPGEGRPSSGDLISATWRDLQPLLEAGNLGPQINQGVSTGNLITEDLQSGMLST